MLRMEGLLAGMRGNFEEPLGGGYWERAKTGGCCWGDGMAAVCLQRVES